MLASDILNNTDSYQLHDRHIDILAEAGMITPYVARQIRYTDEGDGLPSYGLSSAGYDVRLGHIIKVPTFMPGELIDIKAINEPQHYRTEVISKYYDIPPGERILGTTIENFSIPDDIVANLTGKSTLARIFVNQVGTPIEPGFQGLVTLEIINGNNNNPVRIYPGSGIAQFQFTKLKYRPKVTYRDRGGKYMHQFEPTIVKL